jgi:hypothetical protein
LLLFCFLGGGLSGVTYSDYVKDWFPGGSPPQGGGPQGPEGGPKPESGAPSPPINDGGGEAKIDQRIESEIGRDNLLPLIELLEKAPGDKKLSYSSLQKILNKLDRSIGTENYPLEEQIDKLVHVLQNRSDFFPEDSNELKASFEDSKRKLAEKRAARLSEDKRGYRDVLDAIDRKRKEAAARHYLTRNPNGMMRSEVQCWLDWAHRPIRIQLRDIQPLPGSRSTDFDIGKIYFEFAGKRQDLQLKRDQIPVDLDLLYLEITGKDFPVTLKVSFEIKNSPDTQSSRKKYSGELKIDSANSLDPIEVSLDLIGVIPRLNRENIVLAFANMELEPELAPDWTPKPR